MCILEKLLIGLGVIVAAGLTAAGVLMAISIYG
jgi:hypothetical protein